MIAAAQSPAIKPVREAPKEVLTVNPGFRDWAPTTVAGTTIVGGNQTGRGGVVAIDMASGKVKWTYRPTFANGTGSVSTPPAVAGDLVITPFPMAYPGATIAVSLTTGKEVWRGPDPQGGSGVAAVDGLAYVLAKDKQFYALDVASGKEKWKATLTADRACATRPIVRDGIVYATGSAIVGGSGASASDAKAASYYLFALDAKTGEERWRYRAEAPYEREGVCLRQPVVTGDTIFATGDHYLYGINRESGRDRFKPIEVKRTRGGSGKSMELLGLVDAGEVVVGLTPEALMAFDKSSGRFSWEMPGDYNASAPSMAVAGDVLYFQGSPQSKPAAANRGTLHALDLATHEVLWSFSRPTAEANWSFGTVSPVDGALWVDSYQALVKLQ